MAKTVNLGLYITPSTDMNTDVRSWIQNVAGDNVDSNMVIIDAAFKDLADGLYQYIDTTTGMYAFHVDDEGNLILEYETDSVPPFEIDENGCLLLTIRGSVANLGKVTSVGKDGVIFTPYMTGTKLCWRNDGGLSNPDPVDLATLVNSGGTISIAVDTTLSVAGAAADAKAVGDRLTSLENTLSKEHDEIRAEINQVKKDIEAIPDVALQRPHTTSITIDWTNGVVTQVYEDGTTQTAGIVTSADGIPTKIGDMNVRIVGAGL